MTCAGFVYGEENIIEVAPLSTPDELPVGLVGCLLSKRVFFNDHEIYLLFAEALTGECRSLLGVEFAMSVM